MSVSPDQNELLARARADLRTGLPVVIDGPVPLLVAAVETLRDSRFQDLVSMPGDHMLAVTKWRAETLKTPAYDGEITRISLPDRASLSWLQGLADPATDLMHPMKGPLRALRGGDAETCRLAVRLAKSARLLPAVLAVTIDNPVAFATRHHLTCLNSDTLRADLAEPSPLHAVIRAQLPVEVSENARMHVFRLEDGGEEHYALEIGRPDRARPVLSRLHSACFTGDLMGSLKCDCGPQLRAALGRMGQEGEGVLLYMNQEGRGIGLANKMRAYALQDQGFDTVEANHRLGFEDDERDFRLGANILRALGFGQIRLLTNNPRKVEMMAASGLEVTERVPLRVGENPHNKDYLATKVAKSGHLT